jgi:hypothetical protein
MNPINLDRFIFGGAEPEVEFGRFLLTKTTSSPGEDLWEASSEIDHNVRIICSKLSHTEGGAA